MARAFRRLFRAHTLDERFQKSGPKAQSSRVFCDNHVLDFPLRRMYGSRNQESLHPFFVPLEFLPEAGVLCHQEHPLWRSIGECLLVVCLGPMGRSLGLALDPEDAGKIRMGGGANVDGNRWIQAARLLVFIATFASFGWFICRGLRFLRPFVGCNWLPARRYPKIPPPPAFSIQCGQWHPLACLPFQECELPPDATPRR